MKKQEPSTEFIPLKNCQVITALGETIATGFSHSISHTLSEEFLKISYILKINDECQAFWEENISECIDNFLLLYVIPNFVLPYSSSGTTQKKSIEQIFRPCEICINNSEQSTKIETKRILYYFDFKNITLLETFNSTLTQIIRDTISKHSTGPLDNKLTISFNVVLNMNPSFNITTLNRTLENNLTLTNRIVKLYHIVKICNNFPTTNIFPGVYTEKLKIITAYTNTQRLSICLKTKEKDLSGFQISTRLLNLLAEDQYKCLANFQLYTLINRKIDDLPNIQEDALRYSNKYDRRVDIVTHHVNCNKLKPSQIYQEIENYISFLNIIFNFHDTIKVSMELSLKKETHTQEELTETFEFQDLKPDTSIKEELYNKIYFKDKPGNTFTKLVRNVITTDNQMIPLFQHYNVYIHAEIPHNITPQTLTSTCIRKTNPPTIIEIESQDQSSDTELNPHKQSLTNDISPSPTVEQQKTLQLSLPAIPTTSATPAIPPVVPLPKLSIPPISTTQQEDKTDNNQNQLPVIKSTSQSKPPENTATQEQALPFTPSIEQRKEKPSQQITHKTPLPPNKSYTTQTILAVASISVLTILSITGQYILTNKLLAHNQHFLEINIIITGGIIICFTTILIGIILHNKMESSYKDCTVEVPVQNNQQGI
ncbi:hypothetical protein K6025_00100 [Ehrlichia sp. JZT12]